MNISEKAFEDSIIAALCHVPESGAVEDGEPPYGAVTPGGYQPRSSEDYDKELCLDKELVINFIKATQAEEWEKLKQHYGADTKDNFLLRLSKEIEKRGVIDVLRKGVKDRGAKFELLYFKPSHGRNEDLQKLYRTNIFSVVKQFYFSEKDPKSLDLGLFLNGIPIFTAELKNPLTGQNVRHAERQYREDRDPREPLFKFGRCICHFAIDPDLVSMTTHLRGKKTRFLPFNRGSNGGAGNPSSITGYSTDYLWRSIWTKDSVLNLIQSFVHVIQLEDEDGKPTKDKALIFPRYHQLDAVRRLLADAKQTGPGKRYLIEHSAGSGKSNSIAWLAHGLTRLFDANDKRIFDSVIVITDRRVLDRQLQRTVRQFEKTTGMVENIDKTSRQLKEALEEGKNIIVTTLQKFPVIVNEITKLKGQNFAVIVDEAHSSQGGESTSKLNQVLSASSLAEAAEAEKLSDQDLEDLVTEEMRTRGKLENVSTFAFTATPKNKTLEVFGERQPDGKFRPFSLYSMKQAIQEGFILDVLENYITYESAWRLSKTIMEDPEFDERKAKTLLKKYVSENERTIERKVEIIVEHFITHTMHLIPDKKGRGQAKAMIVTASRLHAVRFKRHVDDYLRKKGYEIKALVAFSGTVKDGKDYTEANMNGFSETQTAKTFKRPEYKFLIVAQKFQTGFDEPLLHTMYVDKTLGGVGAVQTLSRLNRTCENKSSTMVLDFVNDTDVIRAAFQPYYQETLLSEGTDPNRLYDLERELENASLYDEHDINRVVKAFYKQKQEAVYAALAPVVDRFELLEQDEQSRFRTHLRDYVRLFSFIEKIITFHDGALLKLYHFLRLLRKRLPVTKEELPLEVKEAVDMSSLKIEERFRGKIQLDEKNTALDPAKSSQPASLEEQFERLSKIIEDLNNRFGMDLSEQDLATTEQVFEKLKKNEALESVVREVPPENAKLNFTTAANEEVEDIVESNLGLYKKIRDNQEFGNSFFSALFDAYKDWTTERESKRKEVSERPEMKLTPKELIKIGENKGVEFKSTLRWDTFQNKKDKRVTFAILKTLAAFLNTEGGVLLIGVADDGEILGTELDQFENDDKYLRFFGDTVKEHLGTNNLAYIEPELTEIDGKQIFLARCKPAPKQVFLKHDGKESLFIRTGAQTDAIEGQAMLDYVKERF